MILTSGSSGFPKAAVHNLANHIANAEGARSLIPLVTGDAWLLSLPLFHIGGLAILNRCALVAATVVLPGSDSPAAGTNRARRLNPCFPRADTVTQSTRRQTGFTQQY